MFKRLSTPLLALAIAAAPAAFGEELEKGQTEVIGMVGGYSDGGGGHFGGGIQYGIKPRWLVSGEFNYLTAGKDYNVPGVSVDSSAFAIDANVHYLFPLKQNEKFTPYVLGGIGFLRYSVDSNFAGGSFGASDSTAGLNIGGGARWKVGENWGIRPELKIFIADGSNVRYSVGFYYRFGRK